MNGALTERLMMIIKETALAGHGSKEAVYQKACQELGMSRGTLFRKLKQLQSTKRKKREDAGACMLTRKEAVLISGVLMEATRNTGKRLYSIEQAVKDLRANGLINAGYADEATGVWFPLSVDAVSSALRQYQLHPSQLNHPKPCVQLASLHPNHVWQLDASLCVLYYLANPEKKQPSKERKDTGLRMMPMAEFNKNKPKNIARIVNDRVWSFELTDHTSGWIYVEYRFGGETSVNFTETLIHAMQERGNADVLYGVPRVLFTDPGSSLVSPTLGNLCKALGIQLIHHKARNARATGSVEKARDIIERQFEAGLKFVQVEDIDALNQLATQWRIRFNRTAVHSRHGQSRTNCWLTITTEQLIKAPSVEVCRELAVSAPEMRKVQVNLRVAFRGKEYDVSRVPHVCVGDKIALTQNPWKTDKAQVVIMGDDGFETFFLVDAIEKDEYGFALNSPVIGERYQALPMTIAQQNLAEIEQQLFEVDTTKEAKTARKQKTLPFGGKFNPYLKMENDTPPLYLPKKGTASDITSPCVVEMLDLMTVVKKLREALKSAGLRWQAEFYTQLTQRYPQGVPDSELDGLLTHYLNLAADTVIKLKARACGG